MKVKHIKRSDYAIQEDIAITKEKGTKINSAKFWDEPLSIPRNGSQSENLWRKVKKVILNPDFKSEALSWKGEDLTSDINMNKLSTVDVGWLSSESNDNISLIENNSGSDIALLELYPESYSDVDGAVLPACLPAFREGKNENDYDRGKCIDIIKIIQSCNIASLYHCIIVTSHHFIIVSLYHCTLHFFLQFNGRIKLRRD